MTLSGCSRAAWVVRRGGVTGVVGGGWGTEEEGARGESRVKSWLERALVVHTYIMAFWGSSMFTYADVCGRVE